MGGDASTTARTLQAVVGGVLLLVVGVAGGNVLGFVVEPRECAVARVELADCSARLELVGEALTEVKAAMIDIQRECAQ